jgi:hypothetical protein
MRTLLVSAAFATTITTILSASQVARADDLAGTYDVKFEQVSHNCDHPLAYPLHGALKIEVKGADVRIEVEHTATIQPTPLMIGKAAKGGKVSAASRPGHTPVEGMDGTFSVAGRVTSEGMLALVMVGEYQAGGKPLCTQTWNLSGVRGTGEAKPDSKPDGKDKPAKPAK